MRGDEWLGHTWMHVSHFTHAPWSHSTAPHTILRAPAGHARIQAPQPTQSRCVSGLWQYAQWILQPWTKIEHREPGPSTSENGMMLLMGM